MSVATQTEIMSSLALRNEHSPRLQSFQRQNENLCITLINKYNKYSHDNESASFKHTIDMDIMLFMLAWTAHRTVLNVYINNLSV